ncbi:MAG: hypothetical protein F6K32_12290 [Desertifilum sp. SIO1I2]|nr:hypothetical protein [Desertifilum sp. SIO1I2]
MYGVGDRQHQFLPDLQQIFDQQFCWRNKPSGASLMAMYRILQRRSRCWTHLHNLGEASTPTVLERIQRLGNWVDWHGEIITLPKDQLPSHLQMNLQWQYHLAIDTTRLREELGYVEPIPEAEALRQTITWEQENLNATRPE